MIYFIRRSFEADNNKFIHKKELKSSINGWLKSALLPLGVNYCEEELRYNRYGKPYLKNYENIFFNLSHCHELAVCAIESCEVGIDAENIRKWHPNVCKRVFSDRETELLMHSENKNEFFFRLWTLKESFVKAIGVGISYPMKKCEFIIDSNSIKAYGCDGYSFSQIILNDKYVCSVCLKRNQKNKVNRVWEDKMSFQYNIN